MSIEQLQQTVDESAANAKGHARTLFQKNPMSAEALQRYANEDGTMVVSTIGKDGSPHSAVVAAGCVDGTFYIGVTPRTALLGNLRRNPNVAFSIKDKVVGRGRVELAGRGGESKHLAPHVGAVLRAAIEQDWNGYIYAVRPSRVFAQAA
jgi:hypothetical protein